MSEKHPLLCVDSHRVWPPGSYSKTPSRQVLSDREKKLGQISVSLSSLSDDKCLCLFSGPLNLILVDPTELITFSLSSLATEESNPSCDPSPQAPAILKLLGRECKSILLMGRIIQLGEAIRAGLYLQPLPFPTKR